VTVGVRSNDIKFNRNVTQEQRVCASRTANLAGQMRRWLFQLSEPVREKFPRHPRYNLIDAARAGNTITPLLSCTLESICIYPNNFTLTPLIESGVIFDGQRYIRAEDLAQLSFGDFEIRNFAGGIRIKDRNRAIAFVVTLQPHRRIRAHWKAAERALRVRARSVRAERRAGKAFAVALRKEGWLHE
jgi:hypothetical protein